MYWYLNRVEFSETASDTRHIPFHFYLVKNSHFKGRDPETRTRYNAARPLPVIGGVSDAEIQMLQMARGPYAKVQLCFGWLSEFIIREHLAGSLGLVG